MAKKRRNKINVIKKNYSESLKYLKESKNFIYSIIGIFFFFSIMGFFVPVSEEVSQKIFEILRELLEKTEGMSQFELTKFIFLNNLQSSFFGMILGIFLGIFPVMTSLANGYLVGFVSDLSVQAEGILVLWRLLPHGIFELPAIFISLGMGLKIGSFVFEKNKVQFLKENVTQSLKTFLLVVIPLLIIAAIIEGALIALSS